MPAAKPKGGFIIPLFFTGALLGQIIPTNTVGLSQTLIFPMAMMFGVNASVTKTPIDSALVVSGMCGLPALAPALLRGFVHYWFPTA